MQIFSIVLTGIAVVFIVLLFLIVLMILMGKLFNTNKKAKPIPVKKEPLKIMSAPEISVGKPSSANSSPSTGGRVPLNGTLKSPHSTEDLKPTAEIVAVIAAAVRAYSEASGKNAKIISLRKRETQKPEYRSRWGGAGVSESMRPFPR
ncbi:MAG: OadG family protein [Oscillospiraceae bacterium]|nr:OadG family protein [Oscillospiraceae bacterium]